MTLILLLALRCVRWVGWTGDIVSLLQSHESELLAIPWLGCHHHRDMSILCHCTACSSIKCHGAVCNACSSLINIKKNSVIFSWLSDLQKMSCCISTGTNRYTGGCHSYRRRHIRILRFRYVKTGIDERKCLNGFDICWCKYINRSRLLCLRLQSLDWGRFR